jgi:hypothetical protein
MEISDHLLNDSTRKSEQEFDFNYNGIFEDLTLATFLLKFPRKIVIPFLIKCGLLPFYRDIPMSCTYDKSKMNEENNDYMKLKYIYR